MQYSNNDVRRQDRLLTETEALELLQNGEFGVLSMICENNEVYGIPINYVWDGETGIYLHCAQEGRKLRAIDKNSSVSFCIIGHTNVISEKFTTEYESIILECTAQRNLTPQERMKALELIIDKYSTADKEAGLKSAQGAFHITEIIRLNINRWSGKRKKVTPTC